MSFNPQLRLPFTLTTDSALEVEIDTDIEIQQSVYGILGYEIGFRVDLPEFGVPDQAFKMGGADIDLIQTTVLEWDPRANDVFEQDPNWMRNLEQTITVRRSPSG